MNLELIFVIVVSYLVGVFTTKMRAKCALEDKSVVDECPYSKHTPTTTTKS